MSLLKDIIGRAVTAKPAEAPLPEKTSMIKEFSSVQTALKTSDQSDAGKSDVIDKAIAGKDIGFSLMRNTINANGEVSGSDITDYIERAEELNDEVDTVPFGLETDDGQIVKVYVNAEQADKFEEAMKNMLGLEDDIEEAINRLSTEFDIVDVVWPSTDDEGDGEEADPDADLSLDDATLDDDDDFGEDQYDVVASADKPPAESTDEPEEEEPVGDTISTSKKSDDDTEEEEPSEDEGGEEDEESEEDSDDTDPDKSKKKKKKKAAPAEPVSATENRIVKGSLLQEVNRATNNS
jgi:hypothetical protein